MFQKRTLIHTLIVFLSLVVLFFIFTSAAKPWEASGNVALAVHTVPFDTLDTTFGFGIDNVELYRADGSHEDISIRTRRVTLDPKNSTLEIVLDDDVPIGAYSGFGFTLKSPEIRNNWEDDVAPTHVSLLNERIVLTSPFRIEKDTTSALILAFETLQAVHDDAGTKVYLPVIQVETRVGIDPITEDGQTSIQGGTIESSATYGMNWDGLMHFNVRAKPTRNEVVTPTSEEMLEEVSSEATSTISNSDETASTTPEEESDTASDTASTTETNDADVEEEEEETSEQQ